MFRGTSCVPFLAALLAAGAAAQIPPVNDGDFVVSENFTTGTVHGVYAVNRVSGAVTTLHLFNTGSATVGPNWVTMARNNRDLLVGSNAAGGGSDGLAILTPGGGVATHATTWRTDNIRVDDYGRLIWNGIGSAPPLTNAVMATDDFALNPVVLVSGFNPAATVLNGAQNRDTGLWGFSAQGTAPAGYLAEADLLTGTITRTIATGFGLLNTVDHNRHDGNWYGTEFGLPGNPTAAGGTVWRVTDAGAMTSIRSGLDIDRVNCIEVAQDGTLVIGSRHNVLVMDTGGTVLRTLPFQSDRSHAATGVTVYGGNRLQLDATGGTAPGSSIRVRVSFRTPAAANQFYVLGAALSMRPGVVIGSEILDLNPDLLTIAIVTGQLGEKFVNFLGKLDESGDNMGTASIDIPSNMTGLDGLRIYVAGAAYNAAGVIAVTNTACLAFKQAPPACNIPTGENTASNGWGAGNLATVHRWQQTLTPAAQNFQGRNVTEQNPGGGGPDTCWFMGSAFARFTAITGGTWAVGAGNVWGDDHVGWFAPAVTYYRMQGRAPCGTTFPQDMVIDCPPPQPNRRYVAGNVLRASMTATTVTSGRAGQAQTRNWP